MQIIDETSEYIVVNKPAGLLSHGSDRLREESLAEEVMKRYPEVKKIGDDPFRPGIVHRLDKLASGLMVVARTDEAFENLKAQFKDRKVKKIYTALVYGQVSKDEDEIDFPIKRSIKGNKMAALPCTEKSELNTEGRVAHSEFQVIKRFINYTLLSVRIKTGRTHQIRVHMSAYGHPVVGDDLYATKKTKVKNKKANLERFFLVASELSFRDLTGEEKTYKIELPDELKIFLEKVK